MSARRLVVLAIIVIGAVLVVARGCGRDAQPGDASRVRDARVDDEAEREGARRRARPPSPGSTPPPEADPQPPADAATDAPTEATGVGKEWISPPNTNLAVRRHEIEGRVVDSDGDPCTGVEVHLVSTWLPADERGALLRTDSFSRYVDSMMFTGEDGRFRLTFVDGGARKLVAGSLYRPVAVLDVTPGAFHELQVPTAQRDVRITVLDLEGKPVPDATVRVLPDVPWSPSPFSSQMVIPPQAWTDADGVATLHRIAVGRQRLAVLAPAGRGATDSFTIDVPADGRLAHTVHLRRAFVFAGRVVDDDTGNPVEGARLQHATEPLFATSDAEGRFSLTLPFERHTYSAVSVEAPGYSRESASVAHGPTPDDERYAECSVRLARSATVTLRCVDGDGAPLRAVNVIARSTTFTSSPVEGIGRFLFDDVGAGTSRADGRIVIEGLHPTSDVPLRVVFRLDGVQVLDLSHPALAAGERRDLGDVVVTAGRTLKGRVLSSEGTPVGGAVVHVVVRDPAATAEERLGTLGTVLMSREGRVVTTDTEGAFHIAGLGAGLWDVVVASPAPGLIHESIQVSGDSDPTPLTLRMPRTVTVRGRVVDSEGTPVTAGAVTHPRPSPVPALVIDAVELDGEGRFELPGFSADAAPFDVHVHAGAGPAQRFTIDPRQADHELRLE